MEALKAYQKKLTPIVLLFLLFLFIGGMVIMRNLSGKIAEYNDFQIILDLRLGYSFQECYSYISGLGECGRDLYKNYFFYVDFAYMLIYNTFYFSLLLFLLGKIGLEKYNCILLFPMFSFIFDFGENLCIRQMIENFLSIPRSVCYISSIFTILKFVCTYSALGCCCLLIIVLIKQHIIK